MSNAIKHGSAVAPGLPELLAYRRSDLAADFVAGLSVAAVAVPVGVALSLASLGFAILAVVQTISGWRTDLIEGAAGLEPRL